MNFIRNESEQKLRGGYYTPPDLAAYIARWALENEPQQVLEPSCGDGAFIQAILDVGITNELSFTGFEISAHEAAKARKRGQAGPSLKTKILGADFLEWALSQLVVGAQQFDAVMGNPPFIRYQYLTGESQKKAEQIFKVLGLPFTKHTNAWVPFVLASIAMLKPGGRLGMILPSEIVHVTHAQSLRTYLGNLCSRLLIIDPEEIWFDGTLQGAVILFAEKKHAISDQVDGLGIVKVKGREFLEQSPSRLFDQTPRINGKTVIGKWTRALLSSSELRLLENIRDRSDVHLFDDIAEVDVGIVTGANKFFLVDDATVRQYGLQEFAHPMFGRSEHCPGIIYDEQQHLANEQKGNPTNFIWFKTVIKNPTKSVREYLRMGEEQNLHTRYKCRIRNPWYSVPSVRSTEIGMLKRSHDTPRLIHNRIDAYTTDTAYRISTKKFRPELLIYCFINSLTALSAELEGRHYGGGVLELVPSEIEKLLVPVPTKARPDLSKLDTLIRTTRVADVLEQQSTAVLGAVGLSNSQQGDLLCAWLRLKNRRQRISVGDEPSQSQL
jgi:adenine-specific DNA-methyltransferase